MFVVDKVLAQDGNYSGSRSVVVVEVAVAGDGIARLVDLAEVDHSAEGIDMVEAGRDNEGIELEDYMTTERDLDEFALPLSLPSWIG